MENVLLLSQAYRKFLLELGEAFKSLKDDKSYDGFADTFIDAVKSPEVGFSVHEVNTLIKMYDMFSCLPVDDLPSHHSMKIMASKDIDMDLLKSAQTLSVTDFKESVKDEELGTQERTYQYEVIKRVVETGNIKKVYGEELDIAIAVLNSEPKHG